MSTIDESTDYLAKRTLRRGSAGGVLLAGLMVSHIVLRIREPSMPRPYRTPGGIVTTSFALVVAALSVVATFVVDSTAAFWCLVVFAAFLAYFGIYSRHHLVANSPDEEFAALAAAEEELQ